MIIAIPKEIQPETRVAITPDVVKKMLPWGYKIHVEEAAGLLAGYSDNDYRNAGATICPTTTATYKNADIVLKIWGPTKEEDRYLSKDMTVIANFRTLSDKKRIETLAKTGIHAFALEMLPRISRAQSMDILSSQSNLAGYKAVIEAVSILDKAVPMMMTAAGTIAPARVLVLGAGVAGLQAIATAKRLGAQVYASDVRPQVKEQVESLGGRFLDIGMTENLETDGGYAKEASEEYKKKQTLAVAEQLTKTDIAITTALIPGKKSPILITQKMIETMPSGSVIIDMAADNGGNVEGSIPNKTVEISGVKIIGNSNLAAEIPSSASRLFANNIYNFLAPMFNKDQNKIIFNFEDELIDKTSICKEGKLR